MIDFAISNVATSKTVALVLLVKLARNVQQLILSARLHVVPGSRVVLLVPNHIRRACETRKVPRSTADGQDRDSDDGVHFNRHTFMLKHAYIHLRPLDAF